MAPTRPDMTLWNRGVWLATWVAPLGWLAAAVLFGLWMLAPLVSLDAQAFAWGTGLCAAFAALSHLAIFHHVHSSGVFTPPQGQELLRGPRTPAGYRRWRSLMRHPPIRYDGRSHPGDRSRLD